ISGYVTNYRFKQQLTERMVDDYQQTANAMQKNLETLILYAQDFSKYMALDEDVLNTIHTYKNMREDQVIMNRLSMQKKWNEFSTRLLYSTSMLYSLDVYADKELIYRYDDPSNKNVQNIPEAVLEGALTQAAPVWTDLLTVKQYKSYAQNTEYCFGVVKSVRDTSAQKVGAIAVYVRESSFSDILQPISKNQNNRSYLVNSNDLVISAVDKNDLYCNISQVLGISEKEYADCLQNGVLQKEPKGKDPILYITRTFRGGKVKLICEITMEELRKQQNETMLFLGIMMLLSLVLAIISAWFVSNRVTKPLGQLMEIMEKIKTDDKSSHLRFPEGNTGEIGALSSKFN
ncbi:MAG: cache and HAMP domain-containing protein, partial [Ruthenibacterium sp.]